MAKAVHITSFDEDYLSKLRLVDVPVPEPGHGEVLLHIDLRPINPTDILFASGVYTKDLPTPIVAGSEGACRIGLVELGNFTANFAAAVAF